MKIAAFSKTYERSKVLDFPGYELQPGKIYIRKGKKFIAK